MTDISESGIEAAAKVIFVEGWGTPEFRRNLVVAVLQAYLPFHPPASREEGLRVKPLKWTGDKATTPFGVYSVTRTPDGYQGSLGYDELCHVGFNAGRPFESAKEAARHHVEEHYTNAILSAIETALIPTKPEAGESIDLALIEATARKINPGRSEDHIKSVALDALTIFRALQSKKPE